MSGYREFEGRTLDDAIKAACSFYDTGREKLEIEICNDAKGGIFGLVGAKKARIRAKMVELASVFDDLDASIGNGGNGRRQKKRPAEKSGGEEAKSREESKPRNEQRQEARQEQRQEQRQDSRQAKREDASSRRSQQPKADDAGNRERSETHKKQAVSEYNGGVGVESVAEMFARVSAKAEPASGKPAREGAESSAKAPKGRERGRRGKPERENGKPKQAEAFPDNGNGDIDHDAEDLNRVPFDQLDQAELESAAREIVTRLTEPFLGETTIAITIGNDRVRVCITDVEDPGLLIGRDGQNLASLQYLVTRMLSNRMKALLRVQIDAGDYRERQDERLRELAFSLAEKVKAGGRPQVTRPLSSYHRRVIHLALQDDPLIQTHSKGEGELKRVMVAKKRQ